MELWVVAASVGAAYMAKYCFLQITDEEKEDFSELSSCIDGNVLSLMSLSTTGFYGVENLQDFVNCENGSNRISKPMIALNMSKGRSMASFAKQCWSSRLSISSTMAYDRGTCHFHSCFCRYKGGSSLSSAVFLFLFGITFGIMSTIVADQRKMEKSNDQRKQSENSAQDSHEELEMTELEDLQSSATSEHSDKQELEAQLEAELEKLELSMNTSIHPANYAVPAMELSLRLHEVIRSRLEARVMELEAALEKRHFTESVTRMSYSKSESLSTQSDNNQPMPMHFSGETQEAYNEAYEEIYRMIETDDDISLEIIHDSGHIRMVRNLENNEDDISLYDNTEEKWSNEFCEEDDDFDDDDEIEKLLMKIVEKTKQGSPVIFDVQRMLYSMDHEW